ncbi:hypothetical protein FRB90_008109, partial [Tulasnella sp. 427]
RSKIPLEAKTVDFRHLKSHCSHIPPPLSDSFHRRQLTLIDELQSIGAAAFIAEPGSTAHYFANVSLQEWRLSERPLLVTISPIQVVGDSGTSSFEPQITVLTPKFEAARAHIRLVVPSKRPVEFVEWAESEDPYKTLRQHFYNNPERESSSHVVLDDQMRLFVVDGLSGAGWTRVAGGRSEAGKVREHKTAEEIEIMKCASEATLLAIRAVREEMYFGMLESEANKWMRQALVDAGLGDAGVFATTQFGSNAALPHGGAPERALGRHDLVTFDVGGTLHGYWSDVTRTFALPGSQIPSKHLEIWNTVKKAQDAAFRVAKQGVRAKDVDAAARSVIQDAGFGEFFSHRLGHGIGLDLHESPYLRGDSQDPLEIGNTFSNEP